MTDTVTTPKPRRRSDSATRQLNRIERDLESYSKTLSALTEREQRFSTEQLGQIRQAFRDELADAGLRLDSSDHQDEAREDFRFLRNFRKLWSGASLKIGGTILVALVGVALTIVGNGIWSLIASGGKGS